MEEEELIYGYWLDSRGKSTNRKAKCYWVITDKGRTFLDEIIESTRHPYEEALYNLNRIGEVLFTK